MSLLMRRHKEYLSAELSYQQKSEPVPEPVVVVEPVVIDPPVVTPVVEEVPEVVEAVVEEPEEAKTESTKKK